MQKRQLIIIHFIIWVFYFGGIGYYVDTFWYAKSGHNELYWLHWSASRFGDVFFAYFIYYFIFQKCFLNRKYWLFSIALLGIVFFHYVYDTWAWNFFKLNYLFVGSSKKQVLDILGNTIFCLLIGIIFFASKNWILSYEKRKKLEDEVIQTELKFLQSQMSPHFLFNVFNNIYSLSLDGNPNTYLAITQLKSIMKYVQIFEEKQKITLEEEERYLQDYIALNGLRHMAKVRLKSSFQNPSLLIEPMIFLPFFENAFKHGKTLEGDEIRAFIRERNGVVNFEIRNEINPEKRKDSVSGVGLENIKRRLPYLYPDFLMDVVQDDDKYKVKIRLNIGEKR